MPVGKGRRLRDEGEAAPNDSMATVRALLDQVVDPEIPALTIAELGILRNVNISKPDNCVTVTITPTYTGCPAMTMIEMQIRDVLLRAGYPSVKVKTILAPAWTTDWLGEGARTKLRKLGIAPPAGRANNGAAAAGDEIGIACPRCGSFQTHQLSRFGSTACKALYRCDACREPFDYFKCI